MKIYHYKGYSGCRSICGLKIIRRFLGEIYVVLTELKDNQGTSITNAIENIATKIYKEYMQDTAVHDIHWIEHYGQCSYKKDGTAKDESFSLVKLTWNNQKGCFQDPKWQSCCAKTLTNMGIEIH